MKRSLIDEITEVKSRTESDNRYLIREKLLLLELVLNRSHFEPEVEVEFLRYVPITTIACFEAFFRSVIMELVDFGEPFSENAINFNQAKNVKFSFEIVNAIRKEIVTIGEFISHILPCNNLEDINSNISILASIDFIGELKKHSRKSVFSRIANNDGEFLVNSDEIIADIKRTFQLRHIFCHEFTNTVKLDKSDVKRMLSNAGIFLDHVNDFIWYLLYPNAPLTQAEMNMQAYDEYDEAYKALNNTIMKIKTLHKDKTDMDIINLPLFDKMIVDWEKYRESKAELEAFSVKGGSLYLTLYTNSKLNTTNQMIRGLKNRYGIR